MFKLKKKPCDREYPSKNVASCEDRAQGNIRLFLAIGSVILVLAFLKAGLAPLGPIGENILYAIMGAYLAYTIGIAFLVNREPKSSPWWRYTNVIADISSLSATAWALGEYASVFYPLYLWTIIGHGMRFGPRFLWLSQLMGAFGFMLAFYANPFWAEHLPITIGMAAGMVMLPLAYNTMISRLHAANEKLNQKKAELETQLKASSLAALHDSLTGLPNRRYLEKEIEKEIAHALKNGQQFSLLFIDLDKFKYVNDTLGHKAGDKLLKLAAQRIKNETREVDFVARLGGDEFGVILRNTNHKEAEITINRLKKSATEPFNLYGETAYIGVSVGLATFPKDGDDIDKLLVFSDNNMYQEKREKKAA